MIAEQERNDDPLITLQLRRSWVAAFMRSLVQQPWSIANPIIVSLQEQASAYDTAQAKAASDAAKAARSGETAAPAEKKPRGRKATAVVAPVGPVVGDPPEGGGPTSVGLSLL